MAAEATKTRLPLHKKIPVQKGHDTEQPLRIGERQESTEVQAGPTGIRKLRLKNTIPPIPPSILRVFCLHEIYINIYIYS